MKLIDHKALLTFMTMSPYISNNVTDISADIDTDIISVSLMNFTNIRYYRYADISTDANIRYYYWCISIMYRYIYLVKWVQHIVKLSHHCS